MANRVLEMTTPTRWAVALDVGGTEVRSALVNDHGDLGPGWPRSTPVDTKGPAESILGSLADCLRLPLERAAANGLTPVGIGVAMPGPFDYTRGISLIRGLDKFEAIYGLNVREELRRLLRLGEAFPIRFQVDAWMFVLGEVWRGEAQGFSRAIGVTLGTGLGSGFFADGRFVKEGPRIPWYGWVGSLPFGGGILDDRVSRRGILARYAELGGDAFPAADVAQIAARALEGEELASRVFAETGAILGETLRPTAEAFGAEVLVLGGRIARAFSLFSAPLAEQLRAVATLRKIAQTREYEISSLRGAAQLVFEDFPGALARED